MSNDEQPQTSHIPSAVAGGSKKSKKKRNKKPAATLQSASTPLPQTTDAPASSTAAHTTASQTPPDQSPLFPTVQSSRTGVERVDYGTNDTLTMLKPIPTAVVTERLESVLQAVRQLDNTCCHPAGCRTKVSLIYQECKHCEKRYCMRHGLPEVHGCGEAIRKAERADFLRPVPVKTRQREEDTKKARERMEQKLKDMQLSRRAKPAGQKKN